MPVLRFQKAATITMAQLGKLLPSGSLSAISVPQPGEMLDVTVTAGGVTDCTDVMAAAGYTLIATDPVPTLATAAAAAVPPVTSVRSVSTDLAIGAIADGQVVVRSGANLVGAGSAFDIRDVTVWDHFVSGNVDLDELGTAGWRTSVTGTGAAIDLLPEAGHPGVAELLGGTAAAGRAAIYLGESSSLGNWVILGAQNTITYEWLVKFAGAASILSANLERFTCGFGDEFEAAGSAEHQNGVYLEFDPSQSANWRFRSAAAGARTTVTGTTAVAADTWYRIGCAITFPGGLPSAQFSVNGAAQGTPITLTMPSVITGYGARVDATGAVSPAVRLDYTLIQQVSAKET